jgi:hypothetical protein
LADYPAEKLPDPAAAEKFLLLLQQLLPCGSTLGLRYDFWIFHLARWRSHHHFPFRFGFSDQIILTSLRSEAPQVEGSHGIFGVTGVRQPFLRSSPEEPIRTNFRHFRQDRSFFAAVLDSGVKSLERRSLNQGVMTVGCLRRNNVHEGHAIA